MSFSLTDLFLAMGIGQGLILLLAIEKMMQSPKSTTRWLQLIILMSMIMLGGRIMIIKQITEWTLRVFIFIDVTIFLFGPSVLFYIKSILKPEAQRISFLHWLPASAHLLFFLWTSTLGFTDFMELMNSGVLGFPFFIMETAGLVSLLAYSSLAARSLLVALKESGDTIVNDSQRTFLKTLVFSMLILGGAWVASYVETNFLRLGIRFLSYHNIWLLTPIFFFAITILGLFHPNVLQKPIGKTRFVERLSQEKKEKLETQLRNWLIENAIYLKPDLTLTELAEKVGVSANDLSWYINTVYKKTFYDLINEHRIKAFENKVRSYEHKQRTLLALAYEVGFNSKTTFNKVFKEIKQETPSQFVRKMEATHPPLVA